MLAYEHYLISLSHIEELLNEHPRAKITQELRNNEKNILDLNLDEFFDFQLSFAQEVFSDKISIISSEWLQWLRELSVLIISKPQLHAFYDRTDELQNLISLTPPQVLDLGLIDSLLPAQQLFYYLYLVHHYIEVDLNLARLHLTQAYQKIDQIQTPQQQLIISMELFSEMLYLEQNDQAMELLDLMMLQILALKEKQFDLGQIYLVYDFLVESLLKYDFYESSIALARTISSENERYEKLNKTVIYFINKLMLDRAVELSKELDGGHLTNYKDARLYDIAIIYAEQGMKKEADIILQYTTDYYVHVLYQLDWVHHFQHHNQPDEAVEHLEKAYDYFKKSQFLSEEQRNVYLWSIMQQCVEMDEKAILIRIMDDENDPAVVLEAMYLVAEHQVKKGILSMPQEYQNYFNETEWVDAIQRVLELQDN